MFSVMLALTVILGIALTNMFLGFASAMLLGRGPKRWSDINDAVSVRYFSPRLTFPRERRAVRAVGNASGSETVDSDARPQHAGHAAAATTPSRKGTPSTATTSAAAWDPTTHRLVLAPKVATTPEDAGPPDAILARQFAAWRACDPREETPCLSGIAVVVQDATLDDKARTALLEGAYARIVGQLRKDRRVLRLDGNQFIWFSADVHPDEGLMPVERIRQMLNKTRFLYAGNPLAVVIHSAIVAVSGEDDPQELITRLQHTLQYAVEKAEGSTCVDMGRGPGFVQPPKIDLDETECELTSSVDPTAH